MNRVQNPFDLVRDQFHSSLLCTAAHFAACSLVELFPGIDLIGAELTSVGFLYRFHSQNPLPHEAERLVAEKMRQAIRENRSIKNLEMVPFSARELLSKQGYDFLAHRIEGDGLVSLVQIGSFFDIALGIPLTGAAQIGAFSLWPIVSAGGGELALSGCVFPSKGELSRFLKKWREYPKKNHIELGKSRGFWRQVDRQLVWQSRGLEQKAAVEGVIRKELFAEATEISIPCREEVLSLYSSFCKGMRKETALAEIYFEPKNTLLDWESGLFSEEGGSFVSLFCRADFSNGRQKMIYFLQTIRKTLNILGFPYSLRLVGRRRSDEGVRCFLDALSESALSGDGSLKSGAEADLDFDEECGAARLDFLVEDHLGRKWSACFVEWVKGGLMLKASVERLVAFLLEMTLCREEKSEKNPNNGALH